MTLNFTLEELSQLYSAILYRAKPDDPLAKKIAVALATAYRNKEK